MNPLPPEVKHERLFHYGIAVPGKERVKEVANIPTQNQFKYMHNTVRPNGISLGKN